MLAYQGNPTQPATALTVNGHRVATVGYGCRIHLQAAMLRSDWCVRLWGGHCLGGSRESDDSWIGNSCAQGSRFLKQHESEYSVWFHNCILSTSIIRPYLYYGFSTAHYMFNRFAAPARVALSAMAPQCHIGYVHNISGMRMTYRQTAHVFVWRGLQSYNMLQKSQTCTKFNRASVHVKSPWPGTSMFVQCVHIDVHTHTWV